MAGQRKSKAGQLREELMSRDLTQEEVSARYPELPELRLRQDAPTVEIDDATLATTVIARLRGEGVSAIVVRSLGADAVAVVLPVGRYLELAGKELASRHIGMVTTLDGRFVPPESDFEASYVEQVNPSDTWTQ